MKKQKIVTCLFTFAACVLLLASGCSKKEKKQPRHVRSGKSTTKKEDIADYDLPEDEIIFVHYEISFPSDTDIDQIILSEDDTFSKIDFTKISGVYGDVFTSDGKLHSLKYEERHFEQDDFDFYSQIESEVKHPSGSSVSLSALEEAYLAISEIDPDATMSIDKVFSSCYWIEVLEVYLDGQWIPVHMEGAVEATLDDKYAESFVEIYQDVIEDNIHHVSR